MKSGWVEADPIKSCGLPRSIDEQRIVATPIIPEIYHGPLGGFHTLFTLNREEFTALDSWVGAAVDRRERNADGQWTLEELFDRYADALIVAKQWQQELSLIRKWEKQSPRSTAAALFEARYWIAYASTALGSIASPDALVPEARRIFEQRTAMARSVLETSKPYASANPLWYHELITVATFQRWPKDRKVVVVREATGRHPDFYPIYVAMATGFAPFWGGSLARYREYADSAVKQTEAISGKSLYATLYQNLVAVERDKEPFQQLQIPWPKMKAGFTSLVERYPRSESNLESFAIYACRAGDKQTFLSVLPKLSTKGIVTGQGWPGGYTLSFCVHLYGGQAPAEKAAAAVRPPAEERCFGGGGPRPPGVDLPDCKLPPGVVIPVRDCSFEGKAWADGTYRVTGHICQFCSHGSWASAQNPAPLPIDPHCQAPAPPSDGAHLQINAKMDCDATSAATSGFAVRLHDGKCQQCMMASWREVDLSVHCNVTKLEVPNAEEGPVAQNHLGNMVHAALANGEIDELEVFIDSVMHSKKRLADGMPVSSRLFDGYDVYLRLNGDWDLQAQQLHQWRTQRPTSEAAALVEASYWMTYAWLARGGDFAANVPEQAFKTARERMKKAKQVLEESKAYTARDPEWYEKMLRVAQFEGWPSDKRSALFNEALSVDPLYDPTYIAMAGGMIPRWGGSIDGYHRFVRAMVEKTKATAGNVLYARLYWVLAAGESNQEPFTTLQIPWVQMNSGFEDLMSRYPNSLWNLQNYAYFACRAGDGRTFNRLLPKLPANLPPEMPSPLQGLYTRDYCVTRFSQGSASGSKETGLR